MPATSLASHAMLLGNVRVVEQLPDVGGRKPAVVPGYLEDDFLATAVQDDPDAVAVEVMFRGFRNPDNRHERISPCSLIVLNHPKGCRKAPTIPAPRSESSTGSLAISDAKRRVRSVKFCTQWGNLERTPTRTDARGEAA